MITSDIMKTRMLIAAIVLALCANMFLTSQARAEKYVIAVPALRGLDATNLGSYLEKMAEIMTKRMSCDVSAQLYVYDYGDSLLEILLKEFGKGKADIGYVNGLEFVEYAKSGGSELVPLFMLSMNKKTTMEMCFYGRRGEFSKISELRGKNWAGSNVRGARFLLYKSGFDEPAEKYFGSIRYMSDAPMSAMIALLAKKEIDVFSAFSTVMKVSGEMNKKDSIVERIYCEEFEPTWVFVARKGTPKARIAEMRKLMLNSHNDPDFATFRFAFQLIDGKFVPVDEAALKKAEPIVSLMQKGGWKKEDAEFHKKYQHGK